MHRVITIDIGNTWTKTCVFAGHTMLHSIRTRKPDVAIVNALVGIWSADRVAVCSVKATNEFEALKASMGDRLFVVDSNTPLPLHINYDNPKFLGIDRLAAACGAVSVVDSDAILVIDAGTAITADIVKDSEFLGGKISPGLRLRLESLHFATGQLPLVEPDTEYDDIGHDTAGCILSGTIGGMIAEILADMEQARSVYGCSSAVLTGGYAKLIESRLGKNLPLPTIVIPELTSFGLKCILDYYENN